jgi:hypothetical protein
LSPASGNITVVYGSWEQCFNWEASDAEQPEWVGHNYCRKAYGYDRPLCPYVRNDDGVAQYAYCDVPHCVTGIFNKGDFAPFSLVDLDWGLDRISRSSPPS